jgi:hypothetical protein
MTAEREYWVEFMRWVAAQVYEGASRDIERIKNGPASDQERLRFHRGTLMLHDLKFSQEQLDALYEWHVMLGENTLAWFLAKLEQPPRLSTEIDRLTIANSTNGQVVSDSSGPTLDEDLIDGFLAYRKQINKHNNNQ